MERNRLLSYAKPLCLIYKKVIISVCRNIISDETQNNSDSSVRPSDLSLNHRVSKLMLFMTAIYRAARSWFRVTLERMSSVTHRFMFHWRTVLRYHCSLECWRMWNLSLSQWKAKLLVINVGIICYPLSYPLRRLFSLE